MNTYRFNSGLGAAVLDDQASGYGIAAPPPMTTTTEAALRAGALIPDWIGWTEQTANALTAAIGRDRREPTTAERVLLNALGEFRILALRIFQLQRDAGISAGHPATWPADMDARLRIMADALPAMPAGTYYEAVTEREQELRRLWDEARTKLPELSRASWTLARDLARRFENVRRVLPTALIQAGEASGLRAVAQGYGSFLDGVGTLLQNIPLLALAAIGYFAWRALK